MHQTDGDANVANLFDPGDPMVPRQPTQVDAPWLNAVQQELINTLTVAGVAPVKGTWTQVLAALSILFPRIGQSGTNGSFNPPGSALTDGLIFEGPANNNTRGTTHAGRQRLYFRPGVGGPGAILEFTINAKWSAGSGLYTPDSSGDDSIAARFYAAGGGATNGPTNAGCRLWRREGSGTFDDSAWTPINGNSGLSYATGWANFGAPHPSGTFSVGSDGQIRLMGVALCSGGTGLLGTLPAGARPANATIVQAMHHPSGGTLELCSLQIDTNGNMTPGTLSANPITSGSSIYLNGVCFMLNS
jgi:hypothetical protein